MLPVTYATMSDQPPSILITGGYRLKFRGAIFALSITIGRPLVREGGQTGYQIEGSGLAENVTRKRTAVAIPAGQRLAGIGRCGSKTDG